MKYCKKCVIPDTRPHIIFNEEGICQACLNNEKKRLIDYNKRFDELKQLCDKHRKSDGNYDCIIAVSGGKDSHFITYTMKERLGMNPLLVCVNDPFTHSEVGKHNLNNLTVAFGCDLYVFNISISTFKKATKIGFEELGEPLRFVEAAIYTIPFKLSIAFNIPLIVFGENSAFEYGTSETEDYSAKKFIEAGHSSAGEKLSSRIEEFWIQRGLHKTEVNSVILPSKEELDRVNPEPIFLSYYVPWDDEHNMLIAKRYGFKDLHHEWLREGTIEEYGQIDSLAYFSHIWMKYPKFGFARATDIACRWIRKGKITREEGIRLVMKYDHRLDQKTLDDFIKLMGYTHKEFWDIMEKFWNNQIFENVSGIWRLKNPPWNLENPDSYLALPTHVNLKEK
ncbi:MAG: N-acetyl sugar amidotransferase [Candidatus Lokiarchaeota archaeon]|nr:N-acetyl sugar amidotransferase [Candidatus Lokiarchaeota archaeon]